MRPQMIVLLLRQFLPLLVPFAPCLNANAPFPALNNQSSAPRPQCPARCSCVQSTVICTGLGLARVPGDIPADTTRLDLQENRIERIHANDFRGLEQLRALHLGDNSIEHVEQGAFDALVSLERLRLGRNRIRVLPDGLFGRTKRLRRLDLSENGLWSLSAEQLAGPEALLSLQLDRNQLQCVDPLALSQWASLETLSLASNALSSLAPLDLVSLPNLRTLRLSDNPWHCDCRLRWLKRLKVASQIRCHRPSMLFGRPLDQISAQQLKCSGLEKRASGVARRCRDADWCPPGCTCTESGASAVVDCHDRLLRAIPQRLPPNTVELRLEQNRLVRLENRSFAHVPQLVRLDLSKNAIEHIDVEAFVGLKRLSALMLFANNLTDLPERLFAGVPSLQVLLLNGNRLHCLRSGLFAGLGQLRLLSLYDNHIRSIAEATFTPFAHSLQTLHLARNPLICDCNMGWLARLLTVRPIETSGARCHSPKRVARRRIANLAAERFRCTGAEKLVTGGAGECAVDSECPEQCLCRGSTVDCSSRQLDSLPGPIPRFATSLLLRQNQLTTLGPLGPLPNLVHLDLSDNRLTALPDDSFATLPSLRELDLRDNALRRLSARSLTPIAGTLSTLELDGNSLRCVPSLALPSLRALSLRQNPLLSLNGSFLAQLELLGLDEHSPLICDCRMRLLATLVREKGANWTEQGQPRCAEPQRLRGRPLGQLEPAELACRDDSPGGQCSEEGEFCPSGCTCQQSQPPTRRALSVRCSGLGLRQVPSGLPQETAELFLDNNRIERIDVQHLAQLANLSKLDLSHNHLQHIPARAFAAQSSALSTLILSYNRIRCIDPDAFEALGQLRVLSLHDNDLSSLPEQAFAPLLANLSHVALGANPLWCDCQMDWVGRWLRSRFVEPGIARCEGPPDRRHLLLLSADPFAECHSPASAQAVPSPPLPVLAKCHPCVALPCANSAQCIPLPNGEFRCQCAPGFHGPLCDQPLNACFGQPCQNGGTCRVAEGQEDGGRFRCECLAGYSGERCERERDECAERGGRERCRNGGTCRDQLNGFRCECPNGWQGEFCESHVCATLDTFPCQNGAECVPRDSDPGYGSALCRCQPVAAIWSFHCRCLCPMGFSGQNCSMADLCAGGAGPQCEALVAPTIGPVGETQTAKGRSERAHQSASGNVPSSRCRNGSIDGTESCTGSDAFCAFAFAGPNCTQRRAIGIARPDGFLPLGEWPPTGGRLSLELELRSRQRYGVLLFAGDPSAAFLALELVQGRVRAAVQLSAAHSPPSQLFSLGTVDDALPHSISVRLDGQRLFLRLDSFPAQSVLNSGPLPHFPALPVPLFLGGLPSDLGRRSLVQFRLSDTSSTRGCFSDIRVDGVLIDLGPLFANGTGVDCATVADLCAGAQCPQGEQCRADERQPEGWTCQKRQQREEGLSGGGAGKRCARERHGRGQHWTEDGCRSTHPLPECVGKCGSAEECGCTLVQRRKRRVRLVCRDGSERWTLADVPRKCACEKCAKGP